MFKTKYQVRNSLGGLLGGTNDLKKAEEMAQRHRERYAKDECDKHLTVHIEKKF